MGLPPATTSSLATSYLSIHECFLWVCDFEYLDLKPLLLSAFLLKDPKEPSGHWLARWTSG